MSEDAELEVLLSLDGSIYETAEGFVVEFSARRTMRTAGQPHGISYALIFRPKDGKPYVRFDNAHAIDRPGGRFVKGPVAYDHWHRTEADPRTAIRFHDSHAAP
jgi:hypothetical protein